MDSRLRQAIWILGLLQILTGNLLGILSILLAGKLKRGDRDGYGLYTVLFGVQTLGIVLWLTYLTVVGTEGWTFRAWGWKRLDPPIAVVYALGAVAIASSILPIIAIDRCRRMGS